MSLNIAALGYLVAAICFILALRGLSHPSTSQAGLRNGMIGMALAIVITLPGAARPVAPGLYPDHRRDRRSAARSAT
jgi:H+-translocating NAD(P) transhydrogenase subunit beta